MSGLKHQRSAAMEHYAGLDVSIKETCPSRKSYPRIASELASPTRPKKSPTSP